MTTHKPLRAGVIGCGAIGVQGHIPGFRAAHVDIAAVCDTNLERANDVAHKFGVSRAFGDYAELLAQPDIDVVSVGLPNVMHAPVTIDALNAGKHVLCEKPMTVTSMLAAQMIAAAEENGRVLSINQHMRFDRTAQAMKDIVSAGSLGRVYLAESKWIRQQGIPGFGSWFTNKDLAGAGALYDIGVHMLDLVLYVLGFPEVVAVKGFLSSELGRQKIGLGGWGADRDTEGRFDVDDTAFAVLTLKDGGLVRLLVTWAVFGPSEDRVVLYGTRGGLDRNGHFTSTPSLRSYSADATGTIVESEPDLSQYVDDKAWIKAIGSFVGAVRGQSPLIVMPEQALMTTRVLEKINESAASGREVAL
jgi:predicted dehydrogenase